MGEFTSAVFTADPGESIELGGAVALEVEATQDTTTSGAPLVVEISADLILKSGPP